MCRRLLGADHHAGVLYEDEPQGRDRHQLQGHGDGKVAHGEGSFQARVLHKGDHSPRVYNGAVTIEVVQRNDRPLPLPPILAQLGLPAQAEWVHLARSRVRVSTSSVDPYPSKKARPRAGASRHSFHHIRSKSWNQ